MQTDYLRYFIDVVTLGSMNAAAKKNFMTPQGISRSISALESELGCELFLRDSNKVTLTPFGEKLLEHSRVLVDAEREMRRTIISLQSERLKSKPRQFICYSSPIFFDTPLFFPVSGLGTLHHARVQFLQRSTPDVAKILLDNADMLSDDAVIAGGLGLFSLFYDENEKIVRSLLDAGYEYRPFLQTHDYVLVPSYSTLAQATSLTNAEIRSHRLAVAASGGMERAISRHIGPDSIYASSGDSAYRAYLCRMGEALTFVPGVSLIFGVPEGTVAVPMQTPYTIEVGFAAKKDAFRESVLADAIERLFNFYEKNEDEGAFKLLDGTLTSSMVNISS